MSHLRRRKFVGRARVDFCCGERRERKNVRKRKTEDKLCAVDEFAAAAEGKFMPFTSLSSASAQHFQFTFRPRAVCVLFGVLIVFSVIPFVRVRVASRRTIFSHVISGCGKD